MDWFLYDRDFLHERVNTSSSTSQMVIQEGGKSHHIAV